jgi:hypothetical protein
MERFGIKAEKDVLTKAERSGRKVTGVSSDTYKNVACLWGLLKNSAPLNGKELPRMGGFDNEGDAIGDYFVEDDTIYIDNIIEGEARSKAMLQALVEYVTDSVAGGSDYQDFIFDTMRKTLFTARKFD